VILISFAPNAHDCLSEQSSGAAPWYAGSFVVPVAGKECATRSVTLDAVALELGDLLGLLSSAARLDAQRASMVRGA